MQFLWADHLCPQGRNGINENHQREQQSVSSNLRQGMQSSRFLLALLEIRFLLREKPM
jgi:hypothetical protein